MRHWNTLVVLVAAAAMTAIAMDNMSTAICIDRLGDAVYETNPVSSHMMDFWGVNLTMIANTIWGLALIVWMTDQAIGRRSKFALVLMVTLVLLRGFAAINNFHILLGVS